MQQGRAGAGHVPWDLRRRASRRLCHRRRRVQSSNTAASWERPRRLCWTAGTFLLQSGAYSHGDLMTSLEGISSRSALMCIVSDVHLRNVAHSAVLFLWLWRSSSACALVQQWRLQHSFPNPRRRIAALSSLVNQSRRKGLSPPRPRETRLSVTQRLQSPVALTGPDRTVPKHS